MRQKDDGKGRMGGRGKGTPNKTTEKQRIWVQKLIDGNKKQLEADLKALKPKERWDIVEKLMQYTLPKMQNVNAKIDLHSLSDEQLETVINETIEGINNED